MIARRKLLAAVALLALAAYLLAPVAPLQRWEDGSGIYHARAGDVAFCELGGLCSRGR